jgi:hypothetical protein
MVDVVGHDHDTIEATSSVTLNMCAAKPPQAVTSLRRRCLGSALPLPIPTQPPRFLLSELSVSGIRTLGNRHCQRYDDKSAVSQARQPTMDGVMVAGRHVEVPQKANGIVASPRTSALCQEPPSGTQRGSSEAAAIMRRPDLNEQ